MVNERRQAVDSGTYIGFQQSMDDWTQTLSQDQPPVYRETEGQSPETTDV